MPSTLEYSSLVGIGKLFGKQRRVLSFRLFVEAKGCSAFASVKIREALKEMVSMTLAGSRRFRCQLDASCLT